MSANLTKKQQKALAFRNKQKAKKADGETPADLPEEDIIQDDVDQPKEKSVGIDLSKKRKRDEQEKEKTGSDTDEISKKTKDQEKKKRKTAWDEDEGEHGKTEKNKKDAKQRFILFVGNLTFKTSKEEVQKHFESAAGQKPAVRLLTTKATPTQPSKSRGIAFVELPSSSAIQACLKLHHSQLGGRTINVELTAGGGGSSEGRKKKIQVRNERIGGQRERKAEKEKELNGEAQEVAVEQEMEQHKGKKTRGGRRVKAKASGDETLATGGPSRSLPNTKPSRINDRARLQTRQPFQKKRWEPTGANSISVGDK
ncbi:uncharacterized protein L203_101661 [Cryptococcus depauperatus CBS 7841]|uniref:Nucleolar protein 12 n=1 Tax=Cryptococcus depauperatus CBS 7841 TaxID=1295531 RepID=A0A1E3IT08_9TREE|nr:nucleolar protein 6 [Cryptococcus depauperatus CBS 7855]ODN91719.1 nucleolar protein 6 [Cryptococcus depauperatus CBS 7841]